MNKYDVDNLLNQIIALSFDEGRELLFIGLRKRRRRRDAASDGSGFRIAVRTTVGVLARDK